MHTIIRSILFLAVVSVLNCTVSANVVWDEAVDGPLSSVGTSPTLIEIQVGSNIILGSTIDSPLEPDFVTFTVPADHELGSISLTKYVSAQTRSFLALQSGPAITSQTNASALLGAALVGTEPGVGIGEDLLDDLGEAPLGGLGFEEALGPGTYTLWFQETAAPVEYGFDIALVPEPNGLASLCFGVMILAGCRRRAQ